jgi:hypothetical protein
MENKNENRNENFINEINNIDENIKKELLNNTSKNKNENNTNLNLSNIRIQNKKFIEEIFEYSNELNEFIPIFKENSNENIIDFFNYLIQISNKENLNEEEIKLICYNLRQLQEIFFKSTKILEEIQFNKQYYNEEYKEYGIIGILFNLYINTSNNNIRFILEEILYIIKSKNNLSKIILNIIFKNIGKEYYWGDNNNNNNYDNFLKYLNLLILLICRNNTNQFYNYFSYDLKKCEGIKGVINNPININEKNTLNFQINFRIREYNNNHNSKLISIILSNNQIDLILNNTNINLYINNKLRKSMNFNDIKYNICYKLNFTLLNFIEDIILTISLCE